MTRLSPLLRKAGDNWTFINRVYNAVILKTGNQDKKTETETSTTKKSDQPNVCATTATPFPPKDPPPNYAPTEFKHDSFCPPEFDLKIFRPLEDGEILGPCAHKSAEYKCPEYYAYHRYSYADLIQEIAKLRECGATKRIQCCPNPEDPCKTECSVEPVDPCTADSNDGKKSVETCTPDSAKKQNDGKNITSSSVILMAPDPRKKEKATDDLNYILAIRPMKSSNETPNANKCVNTPPTNSESAADASKEESPESSPGTESDKKSPGKDDTI